VAEGDLHVTEWDNRELAWLSVLVDPDLRRRGLGTELLLHLEQEAARRSRTKLGTDAWDGSSGVAFAERHGYTRRSQAINRRQHLAEVDLGSIRALRAEAAVAAADYELVRLVGATPEELLEPLAVAAASINDAPLDDLELEDENYDPARIRLYEEVCVKRHRTLYRLLARHRADGEVVAHTAVEVERLRPAIAHQGDTTVMPTHRGHRLGLLLKAEMVVWLASVEPAVETVDTWNAESNEHMIAVNEALGYRWMGREIQFQK
jgi:GNAT superfamily N-acetyltransferase